MIQNTMNAYLITNNDCMCQIQYNLSPVKAQTFLRVIMKRSSMCRTQLTIIPAHDNHWSQPIQYPW